MRPITDREEQVETKTITIEEDDFLGSPRDDCNLSIIACWHRREKFGEMRIRPGHDSIDETRRWLKKEHKAEFIRPLYLYEHSGRTISTSPFSCPWDSGQVGFVFTTREKRLEIGTAWKDVPSTIEREVVAYDAYLRGDAYRWVIRDTDGEELDSCGGYYSEAEAREAAEWELNPTAAPAKASLLPRAPHSGVPPLLYGEREMEHVVR